MRFSEWLEKITNLQSKFNEVALYSVSETIAYANTVVTVSLGKEFGYTMNTDGEENDKLASLHYLRSEYTNHKKEYDALLESLTESSKTIGLMQDHLMNKATEDAVPGAVLARLSGDADAGGDPVVLLRDEVDRIFTKLLDIMAPLVKAGFSEFTFETMIGGRELTFKLMDKTLAISWDVVTKSWDVSPRKAKNSLLGDVDIETNMLFLANSPLIQLKVEEFTNGIARIFKSLNTH